MEKEIWKPIVGFEDFYVVSNLGTIKSLPREVRVKGGFRKIKGQVLKTDIKDGYEHVQLHGGNKPRRFRVHRLVCQVFHGPCPSGMECLHINGNRRDNRAENLKWGTHKENMSDPIFRRRMIESAENGSHNSLMKMTGQFTKGGILIHTYKSLLDASKQTKINISNIDSVCLGKRKSAGGFVWKFI